MGRPFVTVVSGAPRSGTSLLMQMLEAGGLEVLVDDARPPDRHNLHGYYEYVPVLATARDPSWLDRARGRAVKVVYPLLRDLPRDRPYRVLLMRRDPGAVVASQNAMLGRRGASPPEPAIPLDRLAEILSVELRGLESWLDRVPDLRWLRVSYEGLLEGPATQAAAVSRFLGGGFDTEAMAAVVDPELARARMAPG